MIRWRTRKLRRRTQSSVLSTERQKQLWLAGAELEPAELMCPCCVGLDGIDPNGSPGEHDVLEDMSQEDRIILTHEFKDDLNAYLASTPANVKVRSIDDLIAFNKADPRENTHDQDLVEAAAASNGRKDEEYVKAFEYARRRAGPEGLDRGLKEFNVSAIVALTTGPAETIVPEGAVGGHTISERPKGSRPPSPSMNAAIAGYPDLTVPMGMVEGMPVGLSFLGPPWSEQMLLAYGYAYEQASKMRTPPTAYKQASAK